MEHVAFVLRIKPEHYEEYKKRHIHVYPELEEQFRKVGIHRYHIFFHEGTLFAYMEVDNFKTAMAKLSLHPANLKWQQFMSDLLIPWENGSVIKRIPEVYRFVSNGET